MNVLDRLRRLDERLGVGPVVLRGEINKLRRQAAADVPDIDPELERRGRTWARRTLRPLTQQKFLLTALVLLVALTLVFTALAVLSSRASLTTAAWLSWINLVGQGIRYFRERSLARQLLLELPWERASKNVGPT